MLVAILSFLVPVAHASELATLPSSTTFLASIGDWSSSIFTDLLPFATLAVGVVLGLGLLSFVIVAFSRAISRHT